MRNRNRFWIWLFVGIVLILCSCNKDGVVVAGKGRKGESGLKPGINYMQPMRWRMTYHYRVQEITPNRRHIIPRAMPGFPGINSIGTGTYEVWFAGPREGEELRDVQFIGATPMPTKISRASENDPKFYYYNFSPGGQLPDQISATLSWEFTTFERYTHWKGMEVGEYDKGSALYKRYTVEEEPIDFDIEMVSVAKDIFKEAKGDPIQTALACYNHVVSKFRYDLSQDWYITYTGLDAMTNASRCWKNKHGVCDEFASLYCAMLRSVGIPARPVAGFCHLDLLYTDEDTDDDIVNIFSRVVRKNGPFFFAGGHAWAEYYLPNIGWIPVDPTWGDKDVLIPAYYSRMGNNRDITTVDYYYGKNDPYRIPLFKDWNYTLSPPPITPAAELTQEWMVNQTERTSGVLEMIYGWEGVKSMDTGKDKFGFYRSASFAGNNFQMELVALGPVKPDQVASVVDSIRSEGHHFVRVPGVKAHWPMVTSGERYEETVMKMADDIKNELPKNKKKKSWLEEKLLRFFNPEGN